METEKELIDLREQILYALDELESYVCYDSDFDSLHSVLVNLNVINLSYKMKNWYGDSE